MANKRKKFVAAQYQFRFEEDKKFESFKPEVVGSAAGVAADFDKAFDSRSWVKDLLARPLGKLEVAS